LQNQTAVESPKETKNKSKISIKSKKVKKDKSKKKRKRRKHSYDSSTSAENCASVIGKKSIEDIEVEQLLEELDRKRSKNIIRTPSKSALPPINDNISTRKRQVK